MFDCRSTHQFRCWGKLLTLWLAATAIAPMPATYAQDFFGAPQFGAPAEITLSPDVIEKVTVINEWALGVQMTPQERQEFTNIIRREWDRDGGKLKQTVSQLLPAYDQLMQLPQETRRISRRASTLNFLRGTPDRAATVIQTLRSEDSIKILGRSPVLEEDYRWFQVEAKQKTGWVREDLVRLYNPFTIPLPVVNGVTIQIRPRPWFMEIDAKIEAGIRSALNLGFRDRIRYMFQSLDYDGTGAKGIVLVYLRGLQVCGPAGCTLLVLQSTTSGYRVMSRIPWVNQPVVITTQKTNGYPDLIVQTSGDGRLPAYRRLRFDGATYPTNVSSAPELPAGTSITNGIALASRMNDNLVAPLVTV